MKIEIVTKNLTNEGAARKFIQEKVKVALDRINAKTERVIVRIENESHSSEAFDGKCHIDVSLIPSGQIHVSASGDSEFETILQATLKMEHAIKHDIDRHRRSSRVRHH